MNFPVKCKIRTKMTVLVLSISLLSLIVILITARLILQKEMYVSTNSLQDLKNTASLDSGQELTEQAFCYLSRLIDSETSRSNYIFKIIEFELAETGELISKLYNENIAYNRSIYQKLAISCKNPDLVFYYSLAPGIPDARVQPEIQLLGSMHDQLRAIIKNNKNKDILPELVDGIFIGTASGIFFNMSWNPYYDKNFDARKREWYREGVASGSTGWTDVYEDAATHSHTITCYQPVYDNAKKIKAVVGMDMTLDAMIELNTLHFKDVGEVLVLDNTATIINYSRLKAELADFTGNTGNLNNTPNKELRLFYQSIGLEKEKKTESKPTIINYNGISKLVLYSPIKAPSLEILVISDLEDITDSVTRITDSIGKASDILINYSTGSFRKNIFLILIVFLIIAILTIIIMLRFSKLLTHPITLLTDKVELIGNGNLDEKLEINSGDELETLAGAFNKMTCDLKKYISELAETTAAKQRIESELQIARKIQASMLPRIFPPFPQRKEFEIYASMNPARDVGGDYFDFFLINDHKLFFTVGDVSGKGIPGSLFMVIAKTLMKTEATTCLPLDEVVNKVNNTLCEDNDEMMFVTTIIFVIDLETGHLEFVNAGHNPPLIKRAETKNYEYLKPFHGFVFGTRENFKYKLETMELSPGDILFLYTDGVTEAMNAGQQQYSTRRLQETLAGLPAGDAISIEHAIAADIKDFVRDTPASDDITMLVFRYNHKMTT